MSYFLFLNPQLCKDFQISKTGKTTLKAFCFIINHRKRSCSLSSAALKSATEAIKRKAATSKPPTAASWASQQLVILVSAVRKRQKRCQTGHIKSNLVVRRLLVVHTCRGWGFGPCQLVIGLLSCRVWRGGLGPAGLLQERSTGQQQSPTQEFFFCSFCLFFFLLLLLLIYFFSMHEPDQILSSQWEQKNLSGRFSNSDLDFN